MPNFVIKNDGSKVVFDPQKLRASIMSACEDAGLADNEKQAVAEKISSLAMASLASGEETSSAEIKSAILAQLDTLYPNVAKAWREYDQNKAK